MAIPLQSRPLCTRSFDANCYVTLRDWLIPLSRPGGPDIALDVWVTQEQEERNGSVSVHPLNRNSHCSVLKVPSCRTPPPLRRFLDESRSDRIQLHKGQFLRLNTNSQSLWLLCNPDIQSDVWATPPGVALAKCLRRSSTGDADDESSAFQVSKPDLGATRGGFGPPVSSKFRPFWYPKIEVPRSDESPAVFEKHS